MCADRWRPSRRRLQRSTRSLPSPSEGTWFRRGGAPAIGHKTTDSTQARRVACPGWSHGRPIVREPRPGSREQGGCIRMQRPTRAGGVRVL
eukprot:7039255-Prymnesium_polylepis.1